MSEFKLVKEIISLSHSKTWEQAKNEWSIEEIYDSEEPDTCLCGHFPIVEICVLGNTKTNKQVIVGNCCAKKFIGLSTNKLFLSLKRIKKDIKKGVNLDLVNYLKERGLINDWENTFLSSTAKKRKLTERQTKVRIKINRKIINILKPGSLPKS